MNTMLKLEAINLQELFAALQADGYKTIGPTLRDRSIIYDEIISVNELPAGWTDDQLPGAYRIVKRKDQSYFGFNCPPQSWKRFLYQPVRKLFSIKQNGKTPEISQATDSHPRYAFIGVRPCELNAILVQDRVFRSGEYADDDYLAARNELFTVVVNCTSAGGNCFCASMKTGPSAEAAFDLALTEVIDEGTHYFTVRAGSEAGAAVIGKVHTEKASTKECEAAASLIRKAESTMQKSVGISGLDELLSQNLDHPHWDEVAKRCLTCGNCTLVCPTCFCSTIDDVTDLAGQTAERVRRWDSCFTMEHAKVAGGNFRITPKSRYRQWLTHKFLWWKKQFGVDGCVGCGRCITWCPVGIDITAEINSMKNTGA